MEKHLDFTIDMETTAMSANAAVMQVAIVPWLRDNAVDPFCNEDEMEPFIGYVDLRSCVVDGFDFDPSTIKWWSENSEAVKKAVTEGFPEPISDVLVNALNYIRDVREAYGVDSICIWAQGSDFDIAILRNLCKKYDVDLEDIVPHTSFRDCRTVILEAAHIEAERSLAGESTRANGIALPLQILSEPSKAYALYSPLPETYASGSEAHDALYDAVRSSWLTWQALRWLRGKGDEELRR